MICADIQSVLDRENSRYKGPKVGAGLVCLKKSKETVGVGLGRGLGPMWCEHEAEQ